MKRHTNSALDAAKKLKKWPRQTSSSSVRIAKRSMLKSTIIALIAVVKFLWCATTQSLARHLSVAVLVGVFCDYEEGCCTNNIFFVVFNNPCGHLYFVR